MDEKQEILKQKKKNLQVMEGEVIRSKKQLEENSFLVGLLEEEMSAKRLSHKASQKAFVPVNVSWEFEKDADYIEALRIMNEVKFKKAEYDYANQKERMSDMSSDLKEQIEEATKRVTELKKDIQDLKDELGEKDE